MAELKAAGFRPAANLPHPDADAVLRPKEQICGTVLRPAQSFPACRRARGSGSGEGASQGDRLRTTFRPLSHGGGKRHPSAFARKGSSPSTSIRLAAGEHAGARAWILGMGKPSVTSKMATAATRSTAMRVRLPAPGVPWPDFFLTALVLRSTDEVNRPGEPYSTAHTMQCAARRRGIRLFRKHSIRSETAAWSASGFAAP